MNETVTERRPFTPREQRLEVLLDLHRVVLDGEPEPVAQAADVGVDEHGGLAERGAEDDVRRLPSDAGQRAERLHRVGYRPAVLVGDCARRRLEGLRLLAEEARTLDERLDTRGRRGGERRGCRQLGEERRRHLVHHRVRALRGEDGRDEELPRALVAQRAPRIGIGAREGAGDRARACRAGGGALARDVQTTRPDRALHRHRRPARIVST
jgi:hypothetical protein